MSIKHVVRCDRCGKEEDLVSLVSASYAMGSGFGNPVYPSVHYTIPLTWVQFGMETYCSRRCAGEALLGSARDE